VYGNRGCLHDDEGRIRRRWATSAPSSLRASIADSSSSRGTVGSLMPRLWAWRAGPASDCWAHETIVAVEWTEFTTDDEGR
jgi:hypothetical protein